jgi:vacuolar-type H+-ATPase subunit H
MWRFSTEHKTFRNHINASILVEAMEKVWAELKKIEAQAEEIHSEAQQSAKEITILAQREAEKLVASSQNYAQEEAQQLYARTIEEANRNRDQQLKENEAAAEKLDMQAEQRMEKATTNIVNAVLGETQP